MAKKSDSFAYGIDNLYTVPDSNILRKHDYYNGLIETYQNERKKIIDQNQDWDELQLAKERYANRPSFTSQEKPFDPKSLLIAVRKNGYLAYIDELPKYNPFSEIATLELDSVSEYMNNYYYNADPGFFIFRKALTTIVEVNANGVFIIIEKQLVNPLAFCESYTYDSEKKTIEFVSDYYDKTTANAYTKDQFINIDGDGSKGYFYVTNSSFDKIPKGKYPGYPLYKRIIVDGVVNDFDTVSVVNQEINIKNNVGKVLEGDYAESETGKCKMFIEKSGNQNFLHFIFTPKYLPEIKQAYPLDIEFKKGTTSYKDTVQISTFINEFNPYKGLLTIKSPDIYLEVPTIYEISFDKSNYITVDQAKAIKTAKMYFLDQVIDMALTYTGTTNNGNTFNYSSDPIKLPTVKDIPKDIRIVMNPYAEDVNKVNPPVFLDGYTTSAIYPVPLNYLRVEQKILSEFKYTEGSTAKYRFTFSGVGTLTIKGISLYRVTDELGYFETKDFEMEFVSEKDGLFTYDVSISNKVFLNPENKTADNMKFIFMYNCVRNDDNTPKDWLGEPLTGPMTITYVSDRWEIREAAIDNPLIGDATLSFKVYDKLLKAYTDKYNADRRLRLEDIIADISSNSTPIDGELIWDFKSAKWNYRINTKRYGTVTLLLRNAVAKSNQVSLAHAKPDIPISPNITQTTQYVLSKGRVYITLDYDDVIKRITINDREVGINSEFENSSVWGGKYWITTIYDPATNKIVALGLDLIPANTDPITLNLKINQVNDFDYTGWDVNFDVNVTVKPQAETLAPTIVITNFGYGKESTATLALIKPVLEDAQVVADTIDPSTGKTIDHPNFDPIGKSNFESNNFVIPNEVNTKKDFRLDFKIYEHTNAAKDNKLPNDLFYIVSLPFKVPS